MDWTDIAEVGAAETATEMQYAAEALRRRIALYRQYLRGGVPGTLAITYLRQIASDVDQLAALASRATAAARSTLGPYTRRFL